jgi:Fe-S-cluster containining protein
MNKLSLLHECQKCKSKCCKTGDLIGSPILSSREVVKFTKLEFYNLQKIETSDGIYWIIKNQKPSNKCAFLDDDFKCRIENKKPLDCLCYPIKAIWHKNNIEYILDDLCPSSKNLSPTFINEAKVVALKSIRRFSPVVYNHWLNNHVGWVNKKSKSTL